MGAPARLVGMGWVDGNVVTEAAMLKWGWSAAGWQWLVQCGEDGLACFGGWTGWSASGANGWAGLAHWLSVGLVDVGLGSFG
ncbi:hypothetical protein TIFTF001_031644 [Ficus carica]|uniref:Uncharacterized protein n=1 Tax=Ficus carica TaxID=3494 RepID=A0AA88DXR9_FICCA|nr:hypothetical protein TIFTF001_031644 [Ficus carica]